MQVPIEALTTPRLGVLDAYAPTSWYFLHSQCVSSSMYFIVVYCKFINVSTLHIKVHLFMIVE